MIELYKILTGKYDKQVTDFIKLSTNETRGHQYKIAKIQIKKDIRKYSFVHRSVNMWNSLPQEVVDAPSVAAFERRLDKLWRAETAKFDYTETISTNRPSMRTIRNVGGNTDLMAEA
jgi:hypothetical protein